MDNNYEYDTRELLEKQIFNIIIGDRCLEAYPYDYYCLYCIYALCQNIITSMFQTKNLSTFYLFIKY